MKQLLIALLCISSAMAKKGDIFIAIELPRSIKDEVMRVQQYLTQQSGSSVLQFHKPDDLHITLQLIGNVLDPHDPHYIAEDQLEQVIEAIHDAATWLSKTDPTFKLTADKIGNGHFVVGSTHAKFVFPRSNTLTSLVKLIRSNLKARKIPYNAQRMDFPDNSHMSIAEVAPGRSQPFGSVALSKKEFPLRRIVLMQSVHERGRLYKIIGAVPITQ